MAFPHDFRLRVMNFTNVRAHSSSNCRHMIRKISEADLAMEQCARKCDRREEQRLRSGKHNSDSAAATIAEN
jgi:hypothetical protein